MNEMTQILDAKWATQFELPPKGNMMESGPHSREVFIRQGSRMFGVIEKCIEENVRKPIKDLNILDFGCGNGRVALPFFHNYGKPSMCLDVDAGVVDYLRRVIPGANPTKSMYEPPLPLADKTFDVVYAISVWTHLPDNLQSAWLAEISRILKDGGLALISTSSYAALAGRRNWLADWRDIGDEELKRRGFIFKACPATPGVTGTYGYAAHDPDWIKNNWSKWFDVLETKTSAIEGLQDLNILRKKG